jgi:hypothetical protein
MGGSVTRHEHLPVRRSDALVTGITFVLAVVAPPVGLAAAIAFGVVAARHGARTRARLFFIIAGIAAVIIVTLVLIGFRASTGGSGSGGVIHSGGVVHG